MTPERGFRYITRVMGGGQAVGLTLSAIPHMGSPEALTRILIGELRQRRITYGVDEEAIQRLITEHTTEVEVVVARGTPPRRGRDAELELVQLPPSLMATPGEDGRVDFHNIENVSQVKAGDLISRKTPGDPGEPGVNVFGQVVRPPQVRDARHPAGKNTVISEDGLEMRAAIDGFLRWDGEHISVLRLYVVMGNVDYRSGNVHYQGDTEIYGDVEAGFEVVAGGDVHIFGNVDGGRVVSEGTVTVRGGVIGSSEGLASIKAAGNIHIGRARSALLETSGGSITAQDAVEHSHIHAAGDLHLHAGPAMSCVIDVGGQIDVHDVTEEHDAGVRPRPAEWGRNQRKYLRVMLNPPLEVQLLGSPPASGTLLDLSAGGARICLEQRLREGQS